MMTERIMYGLVLDQLTALLETTVTQEHLNGYQAGRVRQIFVTAQQLAEHEASTEQVAWAKLADTAERLWDAIRSGRLPAVNALYDQVVGHGALQLPQTASR